MAPLTIATLLTKDANEQGKWLIQTFGLDAEPVRYKPLTQKTNIPNILISLIVHTTLRVYSSILNSQDSLAKIFSLLKKKVEDTVEHRISRTEQNLVNSGIPHQDTQQTIPKSVPDDHQSLQNPPVDPDVMQIFSDADTVLPPPSLSTIDAKPNKSKKAATKSIEKVYVNQLIPNDKMNNDHTKPSTIFSHYSIKALKHFNSGGKFQIVAYFKRYQDVEICHKTTFNFNYNNTDHSLPLCASPISSQNKNKKPTKNSNKQNSGFPKARFTNSKPTNDQAKTSKKSKDKKKKKSLGKTSNDKMDIVKLNFC
ncbi:hypothetical protein RclHR1_00400013 [Rhizophagus clarus]|uniref:Uncharacterized protein n=1 Tax=Rhizophagus clarus TaxID=94130 RepID=A0A2Z6S964_9GLOM|nr:hypothetical protein RclHR1_00400013 [Rhizophagus clarus]